MPDLLIFSWTRTVWGWITMHVLCCTFACWYCCLFYYFKKKIVAFVVGWTNLNEMAVMTWKYSSWTDQITCLSLKIEIDLYAYHLPSEISLIFSLFARLDSCCLYWMEGFVAIRTNKHPLLKTLRTLAGRIEPINLLPPLSN